MIHNLIPPLLSWPRRKIKIAVEIAIPVIVIVFIVSITVYCGIWPPVSTVASESMTHSDYWDPGTLNVGDIVFVKRVTDVPGPVITYVVGRETGYSTYGEYGNVILYKNPSGETIIHRAIFYLCWNGSTPEVQGYHGQSWIIINDSYVIIMDMGYAHRNLFVNLKGMQGHDGFITVGDYNLAVAAAPIKFNSTLTVYKAADQNIGITNLPVSARNIVGIAFWDIPWFGLIKLNILRLYGKWPQYNEVAKDSYDLLGGVTFLILLAIFFPYSRFIGNNRKRSRNIKNKRKG